MTENEKDILNIHLLKKEESRVTGNHTHGNGQLMKARTGLLTVDVAGHCLVIPATHVVWIPPHISHGLRLHGTFSGWSMYIEEGVCQQLPQKPCSLVASKLLNVSVERLLLLKEGNDIYNIRIKHILHQLILEEIQLLSHQKLDVPLPQHAKLLNMVSVLVNSPSDERTSQDWANHLGLSLRHFSRLFMKDTGFTFTHWRQRLRVLYSLDRVIGGESVKSIALSLGYSNVSAFIAVFHHIMQMTPMQYKKTVQHKGSMNE